MTTPIRRQYLDLKKRHPGAILFFRLGDFYETFDEDAELVARELDIVLTSKPMGKGIRVPLAGVPWHSIDGHVAKLVKRGHRVAICEQMADPASVKGLVPREVVRTVTAGTVTSEAALSAETPNELAALVERNCRQARRFAAGLQDAGFEILNDVVLNQALVAFGDDRTTERVIRGVQRDGTCWCGGTRWNGRAAMRISVSSWATADDDVERSLAAIILVANQVRGQA